MQDKDVVTQGGLAATLPAMSIHERIKRRRLELGLSLEDVGDAAGVSWQTVQQWEKKTGPKRTRLPGVAHALKTTPEYLLFGMESSPPKGVPPSRGPQSGGWLAHPASDVQPMIEPTTIVWESILTEPLPPFFRAVIPDDAMGAEFPRGCAVTFCTTEGPPRARDLVLVRDADGGVYFREYQTGRGGRWQAVALLSGYQALDSEADGLEVLAISMGRWGRRG